MATTPTNSVPLKLAGFGKTRRIDSWWIQPLITVIVFTAFLVWAHFRVFEGRWFYSDKAVARLVGGGATVKPNYLSPFYSPLFFEVGGTEPNTGHAWFSATRPAWLPPWVTPAMFILIFPAGFRFTCYYYRGAYYKAFWADPPSCAVAEPRSNYRGEQKLPLTFQNIHRYFFYFALLFLPILLYDAVSGLFFKQLDAGGQKIGWEFGIGIGSIVLFLNVFFLSMYTLGCHSLRHLIGGANDVLSDKPLRKKAWECVSCLNRWHPNWAWVSLFWVAFTDIYVRQVSNGTWVDLRLI